MGEVITNFATIYYLVPNTWFKESHEFASVIEAFYFSGITIATIGYGDISPQHWLAQLLTIFEVFCGLVLLLVAFAVYTTQGLAEVGQADVGD